MAKILITGGAGFIGSALIRYLIRQTDHQVFNMDVLTYAGDLKAIEECVSSDRYFFSQTNICDREKVREILELFQPDYLVHLAAESHVDNSIAASGDFVTTNIIGTHVLLEQAHAHWSSMRGARKDAFRFYHISTDEVYGDLNLSKELFSEKTPYSPSSPYSASKASSDHLVKAWTRTYGLPSLISNCSNNYGIYQFPEKFIPKIIISALLDLPIPVYGDGKQTRDWLHVEDHVGAIMRVLETGIVGEQYNIGGQNELKNIEIVNEICETLESLLPCKRQKISSYKNLITFVADRPGHDRRYAVDITKIKSELGWFPKKHFKTAIRNTVQWYLDNEAWWRPKVVKKSKVTAELEK